MCCLVYKQKYTKCSFRTFVLCLALIDLTSCLLVLPSEIYSYRIWISYLETDTWFCKLKNTITGFDIIISPLILLLIAVDRFRKVCRPLKRQINSKTAFRLCLLTAVIAGLISIPCPVFYNIQTKNITYEDQEFEISVARKMTNLRLLFG